jgi:uncharacterized protein YkwD
MDRLPDLNDPPGVNVGKALRLAVVVAVLAAMGLFSASALATSHSLRSLHTLNRQVLAAVNKFRAAHGLVRLRASPALDRSARQHSLEMGRLGYFAHPSANGTAYWRRIGHFYRARDYSYWSVGENLVWSAPTLTAGRAMQLWIASPDHLRNLLSPQWRQLGISAVHVLRAPGVFGGHPVTIITTDFGVRR